MFSGLPFGYMVVLIAVFLVLPPVLYVLVARNRG